MPIQTEIKVGFYKPPKKFRKHVDKSIRFKRHATKKDLALVFKGNKKIGTVNKWGVVKDLSRRQNVIFHIPMGKTTLLR